MPRLCGIVCGTPDTNRTFHRVTGSRRGLLYPMSYWGARLTASQFLLFSSHSGLNSDTPKGMKLGTGARLFRCRKAGNVQPPP